MNRRQPVVSVIICTYNRGDRAVATVESVLANTHSSFEVILIDQSVDRKTADALDRFREDPRFKYVYTPTPGKGHALNLSLAYARGDIIAMTDDDCTVPTNWLDSICTIFEKDERIAVVFCNVVPAYHDQNIGLIPQYLGKGNRLICCFWQKRDARGMGAGMAVRREVVVALGGFDINTGPGSLFRSADDLDLAMRVLVKHLWIYETDVVAVTHHGFRTYAEWKMLTARYWYGIGAVYAKLLKCGHFQVLPVILYELFVFVLGQPIVDMVKFRRPRGFRRLPAFCTGFLAGMRTAVDCTHTVYQVQHSVEGDEAP